MASLVLSRLMPSIHDFSQDEKTKKFNTDFNWSVVLGQVTPLESKTGEIYSSHACLDGKSELIPTEILFYQKMLCKFQVHRGDNAKSKKVQCIVYC